MHLINLSRAFRVGLFFIFGVVLIWITYETLSESSLYSETGYQIIARFEDLKQLKLGSDVRLAGVSIGSVSDINLEKGNGVVELSIGQKYLISTDSRATVTTAGLLGNNYVAVLPGTAKQYLSNGEEIKTKITPDINSVVAEMGDIGQKIVDLVETFSGDGDKQTSLLANFNKLVDESSPKISKILENMVTVSNRLVEAEGALGKFIAEDETYEKMLAAVEEIHAAAKNATEMFEQVRGIVDKVETGHGPLGMMLYDEDSARKLKKSVANVYRFTEKLNTRNSLNRFIEDDGLYKRADNALKKVEVAAESVENSGPITAVGIAASALF